jgi:hypothetical protein
MRNFFFGKEPDDEYHDSYEDMEEMEEHQFMMPVELEIFHMAQLDLAAADINQKILVASIQMLEKSWYWRFQSHEKKLERIKQTYEFLTKLVEDATNQDEENEEE